MTKKERENYNKLMKKKDPAHYKKFIEPLKRERRHDKANER